MSNCYCHPGRAGGLPGLFSDAERAAPPPIGSVVTFKYHGRTKYDRPRFASFLRVADDI